VNLTAFILSPSTERRWPPRKVSESVPSGAAATFEELFFGHDALQGRQCPALLGRKRLRFETQTLARLRPDGPGKVFSAVRVEGIARPIVLVHRSPSRCLRFDQSDFELQTTLYCNTQDTANCHVDGNRRARDTREGPEVG